MKIANATTHWQIEVKNETDQVNNTITFEAVDGKIIAHWNTDGVKCNWPGKFDSVSQAIREITNYLLVMTDVGKKDMVITHNP
jgi:hypothetical protein